MKQRRANRKLGSIERDVLEELSFGDLMYGFLLSARSTSRMHRLARERAMQRYRRKIAVERLIGAKYIQASGERLSITGKGRLSLGNAVRKNMQSLRNTTWDGKWRLATFDIPQKYGPLRYKVRSILKRAGFAMLQQSIWVFPHECEELVQLIKSESNLSKYILYGVLERIENDTQLRKHFKLH
ncbi:hypothetical protein A2763_04500 [Candidatus Kaiserbacteria bacterium RIFCSPHIGHO2_01_FULL_54_36]|uniref:Transcriptional repressor PaaX-like central Cas2-like domain-containing protein n=1 Tax=Candidatus Kaiserbacteria bacterium RIFCSPHIGHO2_01_FULL_54_36 TaxID=1798482 RepID=A0A1F6CN50_9BACT|nr:MAG: hypothetical protein A2763_04500 [Candidatus Kaiserbacteria bacterium RIFCSPHIGHO2_01_FULL_54_36]OGG75599.1 MAG: hypothetical protein A3A41_00575 [Candidatus Kaiserbacteria bacterium RIFCSPLOWO2_01_FULL_54_22]